MNEFPEPLDLRRLRVFPLDSRLSQSAVDEILMDPEAPPESCSEINDAIIRKAAEGMGAARKAGASTMLIYGAHLVKNGGALLIRRMIEEGWITHLATNGAGVIHDWEFSFLGRSTESVQKNVATGTFGTWDETSRYIHFAVMTGALDKLGFGQSVGRLISTEQLVFPEPEALEREISNCPGDPLTSARADLLTAMRQYQISGGIQKVKHAWKGRSILAAAFESRVPFTVHPGIGYDIISNHPIFNGAVLGRGATTDFALFGKAVANLEGGLVMSIGSAIMGPQVFEKSVSCVNNLRLQQGLDVLKKHQIYVVDLQDGGNWDWSQGEPPKENPAYYLRFCKSYSRMGGTMDYACCDNVTFLHHLWKKLQESATGGRPSSERDSPESQHVDGNPRGEDLTIVACQSAADRRSAFPGEVGSCGDSPSRFHEITGRYAGLRVAVVGDFCLDRYLEIDPARSEISIETGLEVHNVVRVRSQAGGAGTIVNNLVALGAKEVWVVGFAGVDGEGFELLRCFESMRNQGVRAEYFLQSGERQTFTYTKPLIVKSGVVPRELSRLDIKNWTPTPPALEKQLAMALEAVWGKVDAVAILDQVQTPGTGVISSTLLSALKNRVESDSSKVVFADSRHGFQDYPPFCWKMNRREFASMFGLAGEPTRAEVESRLAACVAERGHPLIVTLDAEGIVAGAPGVRTVHSEAFAVHGEIDIVGAGDAVSANLLMARAAGADWTEALRLGNAAASVVIHKLGTTGTATVSELAARCGNFPIHVA